MAVPLSQCPAPLGYAWDLSIIMNEKQRRRHGKKMLEVPRKSILMFVVVNAS
jgi:hypothetical protein